jgi:hypothetical protein
MFRDPNNTNPLSVFLSLLGVSHHLTSHPSSIHSWRCNGVGLFMIIQVIKQCASIKGATKIEIFLQCSEPSALHFYTMIGFQQKNKGDSDDGFGLLPEHVRAGLKSKILSACLHFPIIRTKAIANQAGAPILMHITSWRFEAINHSKTYSKG